MSPLAILEMHPMIWAMKSMKGWQQTGAILEKSGVWIKNIEVAKKKHDFCKTPCGGILCFVLFLSVFQGMRLH